MGSFKGMEINSAFVRPSRWRNRHAREDVNNHSYRIVFNSKCLFLSGMIRIWPLDGASVEGGRPAQFTVVYLHVFITKPHKLGSAHLTCIHFPVIEHHFLKFC